MALPMPNINLDNALNNDASSSAVGGRISNGMLFNSAGSNFGLVKIIAIGAIALFALKIWRKK